MTVANQEEDEAARGDGERAPYDDEAVDHLCSVGGEAPVLGRKHLVVNNQPSVLEIFKAKPTDRKQKMKKWFPRKSAQAARLLSSPLHIIGLARECSLPLLAVFPAPPRRIEEGEDAEDAEQEREDEGHRAHDRVHAVLVEPIVVRHQESKVADGHAHVEHLLRRYSHRGPQRVDLELSVSTR
jgi:hypothetical protein